MAAGKLSPSGFKSLFLILALLLIALGSFGCTPRQSQSTSRTRPDCVTLSMYSNVIQQVMNMMPEWSPPETVNQGYQSTWELQDNKGSYRLSAFLTNEECICGTITTSQFRGSYSGGKLAGSLQGATVAPVSELDYTKNWLEPKILLPCTASLIFNKEYRAKEGMPDGTTWELSCKRGGSGQRDMLVSLKVISPGCEAILE